MRVLRVFDPPPNRFVVRALDRVAMARAYA